MDFESSGWIFRHLLRSAAGNFLIQHIQNMQLNDAQKRPLEEERIRTQLAKTGGTLFS